jgi:hypothetical protein
MYEPTVITRQPLPGDRNRVGVIGGRCSEARLLMGEWPSVGIVFPCELKAWAGTRLDWRVGKVMVGRKPATLAAGDELGGRIGLDLAPLQKCLKFAHLVLREAAHFIEPQFTLTRPLANRLRRHAEHLSRFNCTEHLMHATLAKCNVTIIDT